MTNRERDEAAIALHQNRITEVLVWTARISS